MELLIRELIQAYHRAGLVCGTGLLPPAAEADIDRAANEIGQSVHDDLRAVWRTPWDYCAIVTSNASPWHRCKKLTCVSQRRKRLLKSGAADSS